ncbi:MAG: RNA polymerase sigma factor [Cryomorphaceae bacterium]|nr:RNA polymerase sigma factor [Flavobacteriales bacterium]
MTVEELFIGCRKGKALHQKTLVERYSSMLFSVAKRYTGNEYDAQDIVQDALVKILKGLKNNYKERGKPEQWMRTITINTALNAMDRSWVSRETDFENMPDVPGDYPDAIAELGAEELMELVASLPDGYRQIFNLAVIENFSHAEIAERLDIVESTSRSQLLRARKILQMKVREQEKIRI